MTITIEQAVKDLHARHSGVHDRPELWQDIARLMEQMAKDAAADKPYDCFWRDRALRAEAALEVAAPAGCTLEIKLNGETPKELWSSLLGLVCYASECKQAQDGHWPHMVSTEDGKIIVRQQQQLPNAA